ncbi:hypothetical protein A3C25_06505 [Candidatus Roizmanbacteria bacterium RIFCSPHIGHO2_02_FULL_38_11]|uniref:LysM domain-containing protein n=1 Tax=Candidatus Roizmanbacteria bacterium RIFCSPHIGHO2_02_FULL_38_11 TaxID=1802039 RepID=A0A1F7GWJ8_9BACT|nr:MAG: hypothetical protein A3C25_06505 [Candidatus Roizmanbacteria bacterium RIFCSPHIGHO2_02_FULL_38_11]
MSSNVNSLRYNLGKIVGKKPLGFVPKRREVINIAKQRATSLNYKNLAVSTFKEKYLYLLLGGLVLLVAFVSGMGVLTKNSKTAVVNRENAAKEGVLENPKAAGKQYTIKQGDNLWKIAENTYGSGYNYTDIVQANKIANPDLLLVGQVVVLPQVAAKAPTKGEIAKSSTAKVTFKGDTYTVKNGDYLWKIALEAYGDGFAWSKIATANKLINPDLIFPDTKLSIPR